MTSFVVEPSGPAGLRGEVRTPGDKSISHRALLLSARAMGVSRITGLSTGDDVRRTLAIVRAIGAAVEEPAGPGGDVVVDGGFGMLHEPAHCLDVGNSGTALRLLAGYLAAFPWLSVLEGDASIAQRPIDRVAEPLRLMGAHVDGRHMGRFPPVVVRGGDLKAINYRPPMASAQVKSAVLLAGLSAEGETVVTEPVATRAHTEEMLAACGADVTVAPHGPEGRGRVVTVRACPIERREWDVPGDPSQAAFWIVAALVTPGSSLTVRNIYVGVGRTEYIDVLRRMGGDITVEGNDVVASYSPSLRGTEIDGDELPGLDELPVIAVAAARASGETVVRNAADLRVKESDRIATTVAMLRAFGAAADETPDGFVVAGGGAEQPLSSNGAAVDCHLDHRIAMAAAVAAQVSAGPARIAGWESVGTSYPGFADTLRALGGACA